MPVEKTVNNKPGMYATRDRWILSAARWSCWSVQWSTSSPSNTSDERSLERDAHFCWTVRTTTLWTWKPYFDGQEQMTATSLFWCGPEAMHRPAWNGFSLKWNERLCEMQLETYAKNMHPAPRVFPNRTSCTVILKRCHNARAQNCQKQQNWLLQTTRQVQHKPDKQPTTWQSASALR